MAAAAWRPDVWFGIALNADPNDPYTDPVWNDFTGPLSSVSGYERGRDFELDQGMSSAPALQLLDPSEVLNPDNAAGPHVNLIEPYRESCLLAQWPRQADITGGAVNLFNTGAWKGNKEDVRDPSFESFANGYRPSWVGAIGATTPAVSTGAAFAGAKRLEYTTAATTAQQGFSWPVACIPGRQYTCSIYVNQSTASTQKISVTDQTLGSDPFNLTGINGWGADRLGHAWSALIGANSAYSYAALYATIAVEATAADRIITQDTGGLDHATYVRLIAPDPAAVGTTSANSGVAVRVSDASNYINPIVVWRPDGTVGMATYKRVAGARSNIVAEVPTGWTYVAGQEFILYVSTQTTGTTVAAFSMVWPTTKPQPTSFHNTASATDAVLLTGTRVGCSGRVETSGATLPFALRFAAFTCRGYFHGSTTAATGAYTRVSVTWTATQPIHTVRLATTGTASAGTTLADAIQHEQGAAASTWIATGPLIAPGFRSNLEQYPREYDLAGFLGIVEAPSVDAMASLQAINMDNELVQAYENTRPDWLWLLNDGDDTGAFADTSGNTQLPLLPYVSKYGVGTDLVPGTGYTLAGAPAGSGVQVSAVNLGTSGRRPGTALYYPGKFPDPLPASSWSFTFVIWAQLTTNPTGDVHTLFSTGIQIGSAIPFLLDIQVSSTQVTSDITFALGGTTLTVATTSIINSGTPHMFMLQVSQVAGGNTVSRLWVDDVATTDTHTTAAFGYLTNPAQSITIGADTVGLVGSFANGVIFGAAMWNRTVTEFELQSILDAGRFAFNGETSGGRILRRLTDPGRFNGAVRISQDTDGPPFAFGHQTTMQAASWSGRKDVLTDCQETTTAEQGTFWAAPDGAIVFEDRRDRWLRLTPTYTFGENEAGGEIPYLMDSLRLIYGDPLYVFPDVQVGRINGAVAQGGKAQDIAEAARKYFSRSAGGSFDFATDALAQSMGNWIFYTHNSWMTRVSAIQIDPVGEPTLWPIALSLEIGQRVRFVRRAKAANAGAGITIALDFFVEKIGYDIVFGDDGQCTWQYTIQLSPINAGASAQGRPTMQPWILGDATYGVLNQTTVLGW